jgi:L-cystine transport system substrate-binding protein
MKKVAKSLLSLSMILGLGACSSSTSSETTESTASTTSTDLLSSIKEKGVMTVATEGDWAPYTYHDEETNELVGFDVELGKLIADKLGVEVEYKETDWDSILAGVQSGVFDLGINGITYTDERAESFNFSEPYLYDQTVLIVLEDNTDINSFEDLKGKVSTNSPGSSYAEMGEEYGATVSYVNTFADTIQLIQRGDADATINSLGVYMDYVNEKGDNAGIKIVDETDPEKTVIAAQKDSSTESLITEVNSILEELRNDGTLAELSEKYFGYDATQITE